MGRQWRIYAYQGASGGYHITSLTLKDRSHRVAFLLCLLSGQRCQTISKLSIDNMFIEDLKITFVVAEKLKHTRPGTHQKPLVFFAYPTDKKLCIVAHLLEYIKRTSELRGENKQLLISFIIYPGLSRFGLCCPGVPVFFLLSRFL
jgi:hypothetical protein